MKKILFRWTKLYYSFLLSYEGVICKIILISGFTSKSEN